MKKKISKWLRKLVDWFYPQDSLSPMVSPSLNVKYTEINYKLQLLQSKVRIDVPVNRYKNVSVITERQTYELALDNLMKQIRACGAIKYKMEVDSNCCRVFTASIYVGIKKN